MLRDVSFRYSYTTGESGGSPMDFCEAALANSIQFDLGLGYFSSTSINVLSSGFARFIVNGGNMRLYINEHISEEDYNLFKSGNPDGLEKDLLERYADLKKTLSKRDEHFFKCLALLLQQDRIRVRIVVKKNGGLAHQKVGVFTDKNGDKVCFTGSLNMTASALLANLETIECTCSWRGEDSYGKVQDSVQHYDEMWNGRNNDIILYDAKTFCQLIVSEYPNIKSADLLEEEEHLSRQFVTQKSSAIAVGAHKVNEPHFPEGESPFDYQEEAYKTWVKNGKQGIFAMATGTGKTKTALNCVLHEYQDSGKYQVLVLVPTIALVDQWKDEVDSFGFTNIIEVSSDNPQWRSKLTQLKNNILLYKQQCDFFIISTYDSYCNRDFQQLVDQLPEDLVIIADEAHNIGSPSVRAAFRTIRAKRRIALSATPSRIYDEEGTEELESFFNDKYPYIVSFSMAKAQSCGRLMHYNYYPIIVSLDEDEMKGYVDISKRLMRLYDASGHCRDEKKAKALLQDRKRILHKARKKISALKTMIKDIGEEKLKYCFVYVPEGLSEKDYEESCNLESTRIIEEMLCAIKDVYPNVKCNTYIGEKKKKERKAILTGFAEGKIDVLLAMKCLDEGVDIPRTQYGIFASSTGNPRQFIQRRGRLLRKHDDKSIAYIYDMIVVPSSVIEGVVPEYYNIEANLVRQELARVAYFAQLASNYYMDVQPALKEISDYYQLDLAELILSVTQ